MTLSGLQPAHHQGALVVASSTGATQTVRFQYNPETLRRQLQPQLRGGNVDEHSDETHYVGAPIEQIAVEVLLDATTALGRGDRTAQEHGILPQLALLETIFYPSSRDVTQAQATVQRGYLEVTPFVVPLVLFVWGKRAVPVQLTSYAVTEELFDAKLDPIRAHVQLTMRVLTYSDVSMSNPANALYLAHQKQMESIAAKANPGAGFSIP